jgi:hypothetical protein
MDPHARRPTLATLAAAGAVIAGLGASVGSSAGAASLPCQGARIGQKVVCIAEGRRCDPRYGHVYKIYHFSCTRRADGHYRFHALNYIAKPLP